MAERRHRKIVVPRKSPSCPMRLRPNRPKPGDFAISQMGKTQGSSIQREEVMPVPSGVLAQANKENLGHGKWLLMLILSDSAETDAGVNPDHIQVSIHRTEVGAMRRLRLMIYQVLRREIGATEYAALHWTDPCFRLFMEWVEEGGTATPISRARLAALDSLSLQELQTAIDRYAIADDTSMPKIQWKMQRILQTPHTADCWSGLNVGSDTRII